MKLLLLDKDGTLVRSTQGEFINRPWHQEVMPGVREALDRARADDWTPIVISNQGGIEAGYKSLESAIFEMQFLMELLPAVKAAYFCPNFAGDECWYVWGDCSSEHRILYNSESFDPLGWKFRKPGAGMLLLASFHNPVDQVLYVGDMTRSNSPKGEDENAAIAAGIPFMSAEQWRGNS